MEMVRFWIPSQRWTGCGRCVKGEAKVLSLQTGRMELSLTEVVKRIRKSRVGSHIKSLAFDFIKLEMPVRNLSENVKQAGGYSGPGWR